MSDYYRAKALTQMVRDVDYRWPNRGHESDGWIGDARHQKEQSDHNPDWSSNPPGVVRAEDFTDRGLHVPTLVAGLMCHPATRYVISQETIWTVEDQFQSRHYGGTPHTEHVHESIKHGAENLVVHLPLVYTTPAWGQGIHEGGPKGPAARECQAYLNAYGAALILDGDPGPRTDAAIRAFQSRHGLKVDGWAGPLTLAKMRTA